MGRYFFTFEEQEAYKDGRRDAEYHRRNYDYDEYSWDDRDRAYFLGRKDYENEERERREREEEIEQREQEARERERQERLRLEEEYERQMQEEQEYYNLAKQVYEGMFQPPTEEDCK